MIKTTVIKEDPYLIFQQEIVNSETGVTLSKGGIKTLVLDKTRTPIDIPEQLLAICNE
jgi:acyl-CoA thioesterase FadM